MDASLRRTGRFDQTLCSKNGEHDAFDVHWEAAQMPLGRYYHASLPQKPIASGDVFDMSATSDLSQLGFMDFDFSKTFQQPEIMMNMILVIS